LSSVFVFISLFVTRPFTRTPNTHNDIPSAAYTPHPIPFPKPKNTHTHSNKHNKYTHTHGQPLKRCKITTTNAKAQVKLARGAVVKFPFHAHKHTHKQTNRHIVREREQHTERDSLRRTQIIIVCYSFVSLARWLSDFRKAQLKKYSNTKYYCILLRQQQQPPTIQFVLFNALSLSLHRCTHTHSYRNEAPTIPFIPTSRSRARQKTNRRCCRRKRRRHEEEGKQNYLRFILIHSLWTRGFYVSGKSRRVV